jgi:hypothetical protein
LRSRHRPFRVVLATQEQEKTIQRSDLPPAVEKTVLEQSKGATIRGFCLEKENAQTLYETVLMVNGKSKNVLVDVNGSVVEVEEPVSIESPRCGKQWLTGASRNGQNR